MKFKQVHGLLIAIFFTTAAMWADSSTLKNDGVLIGKLLSSRVNETSSSVTTNLQACNLAALQSLAADSQEPAADMPTRPASSSSPKTSVSYPTSIVTIPAGTRITIRTIDAIDSTKNRVGDPFEASLQEPLTVDGQVVVAKNTDVYGRLVESKEHGTFTGRSELRLELTGIVVNNQTLPLVTGEYELTGKSRGESTAKRTVGMGAAGAIIGAVAGGGKGAGIGAASGAVLGAGSEIITKGDQVKIPSETLLEFTLQRDLPIPQ